MLDCTAGKGLGMMLQICFLMDDNGQQHFNSTRAGISAFK